MVNKSNLKVGPYCFEQLDNFKYLEANINEKNYMYNEIQIRVSSENRAHFAINKMLSSRMLSKTTKEKLDTCYLRSVAMYAYET